MFFSKSSFSVFASLALARAAVCAPAPTASPQLCNGHAEYCSRQYSNITQVASHDSAFVGDLVTDNQDWSVAMQLQKGIRFLSAQTHKNFEGTLELCHTSCFEEDSGLLTTYLTTVKTFLDANPNEVVTLLLTNGDNVNPSLFDDAYNAVPGLKNYTFVPSTGAAKLPMDQWPTLGAMIASGKRLVTILDYGANESLYPYILDEFTYFFETPYDTTDPSFPECTINRPTNSTGAGLMYIVNHFLDIQLPFDILIPDKSATPQTNAATGNGSIGAQVALCQSIYGRLPKAVFLDYVDMGQPFLAERMLNGVN